VRSVQECDNVLDNGNRKEQMQETVKLLRS